MAGDTGLVTAQCLVGGRDSTAPPSLPPRVRMLEGAQGSRWTGPNLSLTGTLSYTPFLDHSLDWTVTGSDWVRERLHLLVHGPLTSTETAGAY